VEMHQARNYEEFSWIDNSIQCNNENEDCEEVIVEQIAAKHWKTSEDQETNEDDTTERDQLINYDAMKFIAGLQLYFMQEGHEGSRISALETRTDFVWLQSIKRTWQGTLSVPLSLTVKKCMHV
jgi:hypothetical protein